jgi:long-chain acyl-CoA synthetase
VNPDFNKQVLSEITAKAKEAHLSGLERVRKVHIIDYPMTVQNEMMTPTFKIKRNVAQRIFKNEIDEMYKSPLES